MCWKSILTDSALVLRTYLVTCKHYVTRGDGPAEGWPWGPICTCRPWSEQWCRHGHRIQCKWGSTQKQSWGRHHYFTTAATTAAPRESAGSGVPVGYLCRTLAPAWPAFSQLLLPPWDTTSGHIGHSYKSYSLGQAKPEPSPSGMPCTHQYQHT
jgi:hypothetical protein